MRSLYPPIEPRSVFHLEAAPPHRVYVEDCGNPAGQPVVFLHGGPGSGCKPYHRQFFNPDRYRVVLLDQRGCGRSMPAGETRSNDTGGLLDDLEAIRTRLGIERWLLFGGSWGATLALRYAQTHPDRVTGLILRGTFLARQRDLDWFFGGVDSGTGVHAVFPDGWDELQAQFPGIAAADLIDECRRRLSSTDAELRWRTARAWSQWTGRVVTYMLPASESPPAPSADDRQRIVDEVTIETHYASHRYFIGENQILDAIGRLPQVPITIVHGRRDLTCPLESSWVLHRALPRSRLVIVPDAGHLASEPAMIDALVTATDAMIESLA